jgi:ribonuclease HI
MHGKKQAEVSRYLGRRTNNQAEYEALLVALELLERLKPHSAVIRTDSELLYCQMTGTYRVRNRQLQRLHEQAREMLARLPGVVFEQIPRRQNAAADRLANRAFKAAKPSGLDPDD